MFYHEVRLVAFLHAGELMNFQSEKEMMIGGQEHRYLMGIASSAAGLSETVPELANLCQEMEAHAQQQAKRAQDVAGMTETLVKDIADAINELKLSSSRTTMVIDTINDIAEATKILALNATIQAVRVGAAGKGFSAVADNVKKLANDTSEATATVDQNLTTIRQNVDRVAGSIGFSEQSMTDPLSITSSDKGLGLLNKWMGEIAENAEMQRNDVEQIRQLGDKSRGLAEELFLSFGKFRLNYHKQVESLLADLVEETAFKLMNCQQMENRMMDFVRQNSFVQLAYATDRNGRQNTSNVGNHLDGYTDSSAVGTNWASRHWFQNAIQSQQIYISDIYRSVTTDKFCFTVSSPIRNDSGEVCGVLALDVDLVELLSVLKLS